jgi:hypothetical protein
MQRVDESVERGAADAVRGAQEHLHESLKALRAEWTGPFSKLTSRSAIQAHVKAIQEGGATRVREVMVSVSARLVNEMQQVADSLAMEGLDEIHSRYRLARRISVHGIELEPVASEVTAEDLLRETSVAPAQGSLDGFERQRVHIGLGGAATGALIGTLIAPGIGTAVGAFVGVFAGFFKGVDSLREDCLAKIVAFLDEIAEHAHAQFEARKSEVAQTVRASLEHAMKNALEQLHQAIHRLMEIERRAIQTETSRLSELVAAREEIERHDARLGELVEAAMKRLTATQGGRANDR